MVRLTLLLATLSLAACDTGKYTRPIGFVPHGDAVRANMAAQIIDPLPKAERPVLTDGNRPAAAVTAYRKGETKDPTPQSTSPAAGALE